MHGDPADLQQEHQGCRIPCVDYTILYGHREDALKFEFHAALAEAGR